MRILNKGLTALFFFIFLAPLFAQDDYQEWLKKEQQAFKKYLDEEDRAFADFLKKDWEAFKSLNGIVRDSKPKPRKMPVAKEQDKPRIKPSKPLPKIKDIPAPAPKPRPKPVPRPVARGKKNPMKINYFGLDIIFDYKKDFKINLSQTVSNKSISSAWESMAASNYKNLLAQLKTWRKKIAVNDWGYVLLVNEVSRKVLPASKNKQNLFSWFMLVKSGFNAKTAFKKNRVFLLLPARQMIYGTKYLTLENKKFYFITFPGEKLNLSGAVYTYKGGHKNASSAISLDLKKIPQISNKEESRRLKFSFKGKKYNLHFVYDQDVVNYFKNYPQTEIDLYFKAPVSEAAEYSLLSKLKPYVQNKNEVEAVNFLLRFVQTSFDYKTDQQQFNKEKYLMPEETLHYPASDCEDRSIFFAYLVRNLLGLKVVGLNYPGHIATAVLFHGEVGGTHVNYQGKRYVVCDPTYINADTGMAMPQFKTEAPKVILF